MSQKQWLAEWRLRKTNKWSGGYSNENQPVRTADRNPNEKNESSRSDPWIKCANLRWMSIPGEERERRVESVFEEIMAKNPSNLERDRYPDTGSTKSLKQDEPKIGLDQDILSIKWQKLERILKAAGEKQRVNYKGNPHKAVCWLSLQKHYGPEETGKLYLKSWKGKKLQHRILYPARSFRLEGISQTSKN